MLNVLASVLTRSRATLLEDAAGVVVLFGLLVLVLHLPLG